MYLDRLEFLVLMELVGLLEQLKLVVKRFEPLEHQ
jgi:hypothetical protein